MKKHRSLILALAFFLPAVLFIALYRPIRAFLPAQQTELSHGVEYGAVLKDFLFVQEITLKHRYLDRVDLYMAKLPGGIPNENVFLLLDGQQHILYTRRFSSEEFGEALYFPFDLKKPLDIGKGKKVLACIYSVDGSPESYIGLAKKATGTLGALSVVTIVNGDIPGSLQRGESRVAFTGCIGARTFEADSRYFSLWQVMLYLLAFLLAVLIFFSREVVSRAKNVRIDPARALLVFALPFGLIFLVITPPFMVPDEPVHFYRAYQVSELNLYKVKDDFPASLAELSAQCSRMQFSTHEKTSPSEILSLASIRTAPANRTTLTTPDHIFPYLPQALGIALGRAAGLPPLWLFYLGRLFNLLASLFLLYLAVRTVPAFQWVFFLLAVMPMTLFQSASLSYDAVTTGLSYLLIATVLRHLAHDGARLNGRETAVLFLLVILLAAAKQPYGVVALVFFLLPVSRFGTRKRYLAVAAGLGLAVGLVTFSSIPGRALAQRMAGTVAGSGSRVLAWLPAGEEPALPGNRFLTAEMLPQEPHETEAANPVDPAGQKEFILENPVRYVTILVHTLGRSLDLYLTSLVGLFGWIDTPLPPFVAYFYLFLLLLVSLASPVPRLEWKGKVLLAAIFILAYVLIETALYVYCNPVGCDPVTAVQGRYFIAVVPLLLLLCSNPAVVTWLTRGFRPVPKNAQGKKSGKKSPAPADSPGREEGVLAAPAWAIAGAAFTLMCSVYVILERFYVLVLS